MEYSSERLIEVQRELASEWDVDRGPERILQIIQTYMKAENALMVGVDGDVIGPWWIRSEQSPVTIHSMDVVRQALANDQGFWIGGIAHDQATQSQREGKILSCIAASVKIGGRTLGALYCDVRESNRVFKLEDANQLKMLADIFAIYLENFSNSIFKKTKTETAISSDAIPLLGETVVMKSLKADLITASTLNTPVLLYGESGVGKEVAAHFIHSKSSRAKGNFVVIHCAAITKDLFESELFGHEKGAFSGAVRKHRGRIELADGGTLLLDEVADIPMEFQVKLLRVLESKKIWPVGSEVELGPIDFRLICSTNRPIKQMVAEKTFREDLFYRIAGMQIRLPPLRERKEDISLLASYYASQGTDPKKIEEEAIELLKSVEWPGNVRQFRSVLENARELTRGSAISKESIRKQLIYQQLPETGPESNVPMPITFEEIQQRWSSGDLEAKELQEILVSYYLKSNRNLSAVARKLQCHTPEQLREFRNFIYYRRKTGVIILPD
jgi:transcriptional regulator with GAF, ATPase, and Fis domain